MDVATSDPPPDMRLKLPLQKEIDRRNIGRNTQYVEADAPMPVGDRPSNILLTPPYGGTQRAMRPGSSLGLQRQRALSHGDILKSKAPRY